MKRASSGAAAPLVCSCLCFCNMNWLNVLGVSRNGVSRNGVCVCWRGGGGAASEKATGERLGAPRCSQEGTGRFRALGSPPALLVAPPPLPREGGRRVSLSARCARSRGLGWSGPSIWKRRLKDCSGKEGGARGAEKRNPQRPPPLPFSLPHTSPRSTTQSHARAKERSPAPDATHPDRPPSLPNRSRAKKQEEERNALKKGLGFLRARQTTHARTSPAPTPTPTTIRAEASPPSPPLPLPQRVEDAAVPREPARRWCRRPPPPPDAACRRRRRRRAAPRPPQPPRRPRAGRRHRLVARGRPRQGHGRGPAPRQAALRRRHAQGPGQPDRRGGLRGRVDGRARAARRRLRLDARALGVE